MDIRSLTLILTAVLLAPPVAAELLPPEPPYVGVSYYPEVAREQLEEDIVRMQAIGVNLVRFGEFAWSRIEPQEGKYDFAWMHEAVDKFARAGIAVELCTPTATPPAWLAEKSPDILRTNAEGLVIGHGGRRQYCPNSTTYRQRSEQIAERLGAEFGKDPGVIAWQIDNELFEDCYCANCAAAFHSWLENHFGTIGKLNDAWLTVLWSQQYQSFSQVPLPNPKRVGAGHHPSLKAAYRHFMSDSYVAYANGQAAALRRHTGKPVTTNGHNPAYQKIDYVELFRNFDLVGTDSYALPKNLPRYAFESDWMRALHKPFWLAETASSHSAGTATGNSRDFAHTPGALRAKMWLTYALGGEAVSFWLWRAHWAGQELEHGSLIYPWGDECANTPEIRRVAQELKEHAAWLRRTHPVPPAVALTYGLPSQWQFEVSSIAAGFEYDAAITAYHRLLLESGVPRDVIMPGADPSAYQLIFSPYLPALDAPMMARFRAWVEQGGTWVLGPLSACRTTEATAHRDACYGKDFEQWLGVHTRHRMAPGEETRLAIDQQLVDCRWWCDAYETSSAPRVLARYSGGPMDGLAALVDCPVGKGRVILLGTQPDDKWLRGWVKELAPKPRIAADVGVVIAERATADGKPAGFIAVNTRPTAARIYLPGSPPQKLAAYAVAIVPLDSAR